jgi:predicted nucleic acid-binding protein
MSHLYFDSSALVKRYLTETGSDEVLALTDQTIRRYTLIIAEITRVEVAAAFSARHRASGGISHRERNDALRLFLKHCDSEYHLTPFTPAIISRAVTLTQNYRLRGYDAAQLATALVVNETLLEAGLSNLTFIAADDDLLVAAHAEGLATKNPNNLP